jgi:hypothetical protein
MTCPLHTSDVKYQLVEEVLFGHPPPVRVHRPPNADIRMFAEAGYEHSASPVYTELGGMRM